MEISDTGDAGMCKMLYVLIICAALPRVQTEVILACACDQGSLVNM